MRRSSLFFMAALLAGLAGCTGATTVHTYHRLPQSGWHSRDTLRYDIPAPETGTLLHTHLGLRLAPGYPYRDLWVEARWHMEQPDTTVADTLHAFLATPEGRDTGRGVGLRVYEFPLPPRNLGSGRRATLALRHLMRRELLPHIREVGIRALPGGAPEPAGGSATGSIPPKKTIQP